jgi:hypothetical protein
VFTSASALPPATTLTKLAVHAALNHGGDLKAAWRSIAPPLPPRPRRPPRPAGPAPTDRRALADLLHPVLAAEPAQVADRLTRAARTARALAAAGRLDLPAATVALRRAAVAAGMPPPAADRTLTRALAAEDRAAAADGGTSR